MVHEDYTSRISVSCRQRSTLEFTFTRTFRRICVGAFADFSAGMALLSSDPTSAVFYINIDAGSVKAPSLRIEEQLKGPSCLDARKYDKIAFVSSDLRKTGQNTYCLSGIFTLRGISRPMEFRLFHDNNADPVDSNPLRACFTFIGVISRSDFGLPYSPAHPGTHDKIYLHASIQFEPWNGRDLSAFDILLTKSS